MWYKRVNGVNRYFATNPDAEKVSGEVAKEPKKNKRKVTKR